MIVTVGYCMYTQHTGPKAFSLLEKSFGGMSKSCSYEFKAKIVERPITNA